MTVNPGVEILDSVWLLLSCPCGVPSVTRRRVSRLSESSGFIGFRSPYIVLAVVTDSEIEPWLDYLKSRVLSSRNYHVIEKKRSLKILLDTQWSQKEAMKDVL
jgi:hypothetical protein